MLTLLLAPFAPHIAEEMWNQLGHSDSLTRAPWPTWDANWVVDDTVEVVFQINGKIRGKQSFPKDTTKDELQKAAETHERVQSFLEGFSIVKVVVVPDKLVNFVVKPAGK
jgi:leucyl-tRNA synthetase